MEGTQAAVVVQGRRKVSAGGLAAALGLVTLSPTSPAQQVRPVTARDPASRAAEG